MMILLMKFLVDFALENKKILREESKAGDETDCSV